MKKTNTIKRDPTRRPTHPGAVMREDVLPQLQMTNCGAGIVTICQKIPAFAGMTKFFRLEESPVA